MRVFLIFVFSHLIFPNHQHQDNLPIDDLFILSSDKVLLVWSDDAQGVLLASLGLCVYDIRTQVHVHRALRKCAWLEETQQEALACMIQLELQQ